MRLTSFFLAAALLSDAALGALGAPPPVDLAKPQSVQIHERDEAAPEELWKRKGGGGGGGRGGGGGGRGGSSGSGGGRGSSGSGSNPSRPVPAPAYGGGRFYGGGAATPYRAGSRSPSGIVPVFFAASALAFWPGLWLYGAHIYRFDDEYEFFNVTSQRTESKPVECACAQNADCGCDENRDKDYLDDLIGNGSYAALNKTLVNVADVNGTSTILVNGTLPDGTAALAGNAAGGGLRALLHHAGWWPVVATVCAIVLTA
ncbi:hypothetical protein MYCTH_2294498 [Thermothelomyces thermophilus ATCC 42464]|uniref:DUF7732 domain-containing protein n=1 Tax=Thermothelomyces thermophilus (strain ATCC 42464 / BCRC 31852 / DSM 1799) TaxID=573729 RepID=G2Q1P9_THET4|nr:uncharacterized protein MYCTH_2294498 [Thermothelomyces thermophilus ATCC 42464]AEO53333.1 hypothetical protein MYCTH_2294498 [Thermothelomyces thermophilus ATCC 42464]